jgi:hypothetical protein
MLVCPDSSVFGTDWVVSIGDGGITEAKTGTDVLGIIGCCTDPNDAMDTGASPDSCAGAGTGPDALNICGVVCSTSSGGITDTGAATLGNGTEGAVIAVDFSSDTIADTVSDADVETGAVDTGNVAHAAIDNGADIFGEH